MTKNLTPVGRHIEIIWKFTDSFCTLGATTEFSIWWENSYNNYYLELYKSALGRSNELTKCWTELLAEAKYRAKTVAEVTQYKQILLTDLLLQAALNGSS